MYLQSEIPAAFRAGAEIAAEVIRPLDNVLLAAHVNLDGDALGSLAGCAETLALLGKRFIIYSCTGVPHYLRFLPLPGKVYQNLDELPFTPKSAIYLDCSEPKRLGVELAANYTNWPSLNIDHHLSSAGLGSLGNYINPQAAATTQLLAYTALALGLSMIDNLGNAISLGLLTDTGGFCHGNTTAAVFSLCAQLAANGCDFAELREQLEKNWTIGKIHLWGDVFHSLRLEERGKIALALVSEAELKHHHCDVEDLEGLVDQFRKIKNVEVSALLREEGSGKCKFSLRSHAEIDVRLMAMRLGGGGHKNASGGQIAADLPAAAKILIEIISDGLKSYEE